MDSPYEYIATSDYGVIYLSDGEPMEFSCDSDVYDRDDETDLT